jgi:Flp pilus assembly protein TadG
MNKQVRQKRMKQNGERGSVLATATLGMLSMILAVGLGVDISRFYVAKAELQNGVDAAALAGASALNSSAAGIDEATDRAVQAMNKSDFNNTSLSFQRSNVLFAINLDGPYISEASAKATPTNIRFVQVTTPPSAVKVAFASIVLGSSLDLTATATAGMSIAPNVIYGWIPLSVIDYDVPLTPGNVYTIRSAPGNKVSPGNYQILAVAGRGGKDVREGIASGVDEPAGPDGYYDVDTKPGVTAGPVRAGINSRFDEYSAQLDPVSQPPDTNIKEGITYQQYRDGTPTQAPSHPGVPGRRIVLIPIVKEDEYDNGRGRVRFNRLGAFFLRSKAANGNGGDIQAEYIGDRISIGKGGYDPNGGPGNPLLAFPVLYK